MTYHDKLDLVLVELSKLNDGLYHGAGDVMKELPFKKDIAEVVLLLEYLVKCGYAAAEDHEYDDSMGFASPKKMSLFKITLQGLLFLETSSFKSEISKGHRMIILSRFKIISNASNAIMILIIGMLGVYVSWKSNGDRIENSFLRKKLDSLQSIRKADTAVKK